VGTSSLKAALGALLIPPYRYFAQHLSSDWGQIGCKHLDMLLQKALEILPLVNPFRAKPRVDPHGVTACPVASLG
jgi:hypothetical protein